MDRVIPRVRVSWQTYGAPTYDALFFLAAPLLAVASAVWVYRFSALPHWRVLPAYFLTWDQFLISLLNQGHLVAVFLRSHGNRSVFQSFPLRFTFIPLIALIIASTSLPGFLILAVLGLLWGEYHSSLQTFGLMRIYHARAGNSGLSLRREDLWLGHVLYFLPLLMGDNIARLLGPFDQLKKIPTIAFVSQLAHVPQFVLDVLPHVRFLALLLALGVVIGYAIRLSQFLASGGTLSAPKVMLQTSTALTCGMAWGFMPLFQAIFVMQLFHAVQYFAILGLTEQKNLGTLLHSNNIWSRRGLFLAFLVACGFYGCFAVVAKSLPDAHPLLAIVVCVSLCHLWFDGFIWSVSRSKANIVIGTPPEKSHLVISKRSDDLGRATHCL